MELSVLIISHRRRRELAACLESLDRCGAAERAEVLVGLNGPDPGLAEELAARFPRVRVVALERALPGEARNRLIPRARGRLLYFLDDDTMVAEGFLEKVLEKFSLYPQAPVVGGPNLAPADSGDFERAVDFLFRSPVGAGPARIRYRRSGADRPLPGWCFTLSNLGVRREVFEAGVRFPSHCVTAEENLFLFRVARRWPRPVYCPDLYVFHRRRARLGSFCGQLFRYGRGRMQITWSAPASLQPAVLAPVAFLGYLAGLPALGGGPAGRFLPLLAYIAACGAETVRLACVDRDPKAARWLLPLLPLSHAAYAAGMLSGVVPRAAGKKP